MASFRKIGRNWFYRFIDANGVQRERKGCSDRRATEGMAAAAEAEVARVRSGLLDPKAERRAAAERKPILAHLDDFTAALTAKGGDPKHVRQTHVYAARVLNLAAVRSVSGLVPSAIMAALGALRDKGLSARTLNAHLTAVKQFARWLQRDGRCLDNPLAGLSRLPEAADRRVIRRPLEADELRRLIDTTRDAPPWQGLSGPDRSMLYMIGAATGFRRSELASLTPASFRLHDEPPVIVCEPAYTKNGKTAEQPVPDTLAAALRPWVARKAADRPVFDPLPEKTGRMLKADLTRAGIAAVDASGRVVDLHSLRHGFITTLARAGVPIKTLQTLARHSDPKLTLNVYTHLTVHDTAAALDALPDLTGPAAPPEAMAATGTDGGRISEPLSLHFPYAGDGSGRDLADAGGIDETTPDVGGCRNSLESSDLDGSCRDLTEPVGSAPRRTRTYNPLIKRLPPSCPISLPTNAIGSSRVGRVAIWVAPRPPVPVAARSSASG
jgi:site-specific recombinase XerC